MFEADVVLGFRVAPGAHVYVLQPVEGKGRFTGNCHDRNDRSSQLKASEADLIQTHTVIRFGVGWIARYPNRVRAKHGYYRLRRAESVRDLVLPVRSSVEPAGVL